MLTSKQTRESDLVGQTRVRCRGLDRLTEQALGEGVIGAGRGQREPKQPLVVAAGVSVDGEHVTHVLPASGLRYSGRSTTSTRKVRDSSASSSRPMSRQMSTMTAQIDMYPRSRAYLASSEVVDFEVSERRWTAAGDRSTSAGVSGARSKSSGMPPSSPRLHSSTISSMFCRCSSACLTVPARSARPLGDPRTVVVVEQVLGEMDAVDLALGAVIARTPEAHVKLVGVVRADPRQRELRSRSGRRRGADASVRLAHGERRSPRPRRSRGDECDFVRAGISAARPLDASLLVHHLYEPLCILGRVRRRSDDLRSGLTRPETCRDAAFASLLSRRSVC